MPTPSVTPSALLAPGPPFLIFPAPPPPARDKVARAEDESYGYVMSVYVMIRVSKKCPSNRDELEGCGNPLPRLVQRHAEDILAIVEVGNGTEWNGTALNFESSVEEKSRRKRCVAVP